jgi:hypothetical protein
MGLFDFLFRRHAPKAPRSVPDPFMQRRMDRDVKWRQLLQSLEHPFELVSGAAAQGAFEAARVRGREEGFCPLIVAPGFDGLIHREPVILDDSELVTPAEFFARRAGQFAQTLDLFESVDEVEPPPGADLLSLIDCACAPPTPYAEIALVRLPCAESWRIPAYVSFGAPLDQFGNTLGEEISIEREWFDRFGAELCAVEDRLWSFRITRPPRDHHQAAELLRQHYLYSWPDDAYENEIIADSVASLRVSSYWTFGWT